MILLLSMGVAPAHAYAPQAAAAIASRIPDALPPAARWDPSWNAAAADEVERALAAEEPDLELHATRHRFVSGLPAPNPELNDDSAGFVRVVGAAPQALVTATSDLMRAFRGGEASLIARRLAELAIRVSDLADPFLMTSPDDPSPPAAHARFSDLLHQADLEALTPTAWAVPLGRITAGLALAAESARLRAMVEEAARNDDDATLSEIRRERLGAALTLAQSLTLAAWKEARSPSLVDAAPHLGEVRVWPNPTRGPATVSFSLPRPGPARIELFDLAGRRIWSVDLGLRRSGPQDVILGEEVLKRLTPGLYLACLRGAPDVVAVGRLMRLPD